MNVSTGGPHILLFERDQQLAALLTSEFQLAGYECHVARTAVEVFDAIARRPVRLVVVNLAQAASGRREFWVALDAQRRGRGVQVFTFRCNNLAGYGAYDPDEQNQAVLADIEIDGMRGIMNLVDAIRARLPLSGANMASSGQFPAAPPATPSFATPTAPLASMPGSGQMPAMAPSQSNYVPASPTMRQASPVYTQSAPQPTYAPQPAMQQAAPNYTSPPAPAMGQNQSASANAQSPMGFTDKIRAVIYPGSRSFSPVPQPDATWNAQHNAQVQGIHGSVPPPVYQQQAPVYQPQPQPPQAPAYQPQPSTYQQQSQQQQPQQAQIYQQSQTQPQQASTYQQQSQPQAPVYQQPQQRPPQPQPQPVYPRNQQPQAAVNQEESYMYAAQAPQQPPAQPAQPQPAMTVNESSLEQLSRLLEQFSPAAGRENGGPASATRTQDAAQAPQPPMRPQPADAPPISSMPLRPAPIEDIPSDREPEPRPERFDARGANAQTPYAATSSPTSELTSIRMVVPPPSAYAPAEPAQHNQDQAILSYTQKKLRDRGGEEYAVDNGRDERAQETRQPPAEQEEMTPDIMLLDIMQSLPPMAPAAQSPEPPPVLNGRATRALGNVLLEGHLVPQDRLEVAQNVQRMLRGVDLNYQLGEILLMFKLLTPDQLLAASLVSYGLITTSQIRSLGRIRQELHSMGLEYDLENLIILFRILTPEQLREVRASWST